MNQIDRAALAKQIKEELEAINAADTPENEQRMIALATTFGARIKRSNKKSPSRYTLTSKAGHSVSPVTLLDIEGLLTDWSKASTS